MNNLPWGTDENLKEDQFYNRVETIDLLSNMLNSSQYGSTPSILLTGVRGVGKTVLMKRIQQLFENKFLVIYINLKNVNSYQENNLDRLSIMKLIYKTIITSSQKANIKTINKQIEKYFKTNNFKIDNILSYKHIPIPVLSSKTDYPSFAEFVMDLPQQIYEENKTKIKGVFVFIDEFQVLKELDGDLNSFLWFLRNKIQSQKNVAYMISGSMSLKDNFFEKINGHKGAFGGRMLTINIEPFSPETTRQYLTEKAPELTFNKEGFERFYKCSQGIPYMINTIAKFLPTDTIIEKNTVKNVYIKSLNILANQDIETWLNLTKQEQHIITTLIEKPLRRIDLAKQLGVTSGSLSNQLNKLEDLMFIELNDNKKYMVCDSVFKVWLEKHYEKYEVYPYKHSLNLS
ncbi:MAG: AAA family ATPase [Methanosphaera sp.]|nr:AAA family ATPase [Methanosphaera sp.]